MANWKAVLAILGVLLWGSPASAQQTQEPAEPEEEVVAEEPQDPEPAPEQGEAADAPEPAAEQPTTRHNGLYVAVGYGSGSIDRFDTSIVTSVDLMSTGSFEIDEASLGIAAVGWKLPEDRGAFRLVFNGYKETSYTYDGVGGAAALASGTELDLGCTADDLEGLANLNDSPGFIVSPEGGRCLYAWWGVSVRDGRFVAERTPATWTSAENDENGDLAANPEELVILAPDRRIERSIPDDMQNRLQTIDALYGREFGGRRYSSQWWAGLRYFVYEGHMLGTAWLDTQTVAGSGFTDGDFLRPLFLSQDTSGFGPTVSWEVDFNFFNRGLVLYIRGQSAFVFNSVSSDSGEFFTLTGNEGVSDPFDISAPARLEEERDKSSWQNTGELGARVRMRNGLEFELAYRLTGYLDVVLYPSRIQIPDTAAQAASGSTALYTTQDLRVESWHALVGFQF
jgi:hypothetical protein